MGSANARAGKHLYAQLHFGQTTSIEQDTNYKMHFPFGTFYFFGEGEQQK